MAKVQYFIGEMRLSQKVQKVRVEFNRIPTREQLEEAENKKKNKKREPQTIQFSPMSFMKIAYDYEENYLNLNFPTVIFIRPLKEILALELKIGMVIELDVPETVDDIYMLKSES